MVRKVAGPLPPRTAMPFCIEPRFAASLRVLPRRRANLSVIVSRYRDGAACDRPACMAPTPPAAASIVRAECVLQAAMVGDPLIVYALEQQRAVCADSGDCCIVGIGRIACTG